jgi:hypothetical protein
MSDTKRLLENVLELYYTQTQDTKVIASILGCNESLVIDAIEFDKKESQKERWFH